MTNKGMPEPNPPEASYANRLVVGFNAFEFILDFGQSYGAKGRETTNVRIVTTPAYAKAMLETLQTAIANYEGEHRSIPNPRDDT
jgi:hypothetical protein